MYRKNTASQFFNVQGVDATTGGIKSGVTWTVRRDIDGTFAAATGTATEDGTTGWYKFAMSQADTNGNNIGFNFTGTGAVPQTINILTDGSPPDVNLKNAAGTAVTLDSNNVLNVSTKYVGGTLQTAGDLKATLGTPAGASIAADLAEIEGETDGIAAISTATPLTAAQIATGVWQDATAGDFTVGGTIGKSIMQGVALGTGIKVDVDTIKTNPVVNGGTITFPTNATLASTTNITAGTIATVTNLTNAPTAGDFTATMKTSAQTAADAAITANALVLEIEADTDTLTAGVNVTQINGDATSAANIAKTTRAIARGTAAGAASTTSIPTSAFTPSGAAADQFKGRIITFDGNTATAALQGQSTDITASSNAATPTLTVTALTTAPASGDTFSVT